MTQEERAGGNRPSLKNSSPQTVTKTEADRVRTTFDERGEVVEFELVESGVDDAVVEVVDEPEVKVDSLADQQLLDALFAFVRRFVVLSDDQAAAIALWIAHTHAFEAADCTPYLHVHSAEKRSGKTRLLEVLELVVREPLPTTNISDAALFRAVAELTPTLLLDEIDAVYGPKAREREDLRGMLNAGYRQGAVVRRMGGPKMTTLEAFPVFCPKVFAGIGELPDTIADRAIPLRLLRRTREEEVERFRRRDALEAADPLHQWASSWGVRNAPRLTEARPDLPDELDDRAQDVWEPLLAIADLAGGAWPARARSAALQLSGNGQREDDSMTALLLKDIFTVFASGAGDRLRTADLIVHLGEIEESPWGDWYGKTITPQALSKLLRPHRIKTMPVKVEGQTVRGYKVEQFADAFARVLGVTGVTSVTSESPSQAGGNAGNAGNSNSVNGTGSCPVCESTDIGPISGSCRGCGEQVRARDNAVYGEST
jgi:Protein of unknown function (DUF3631)